LKTHTIPTVIELNGQNIQWEDEIITKCYLWHLLQYFKTFNIVIIQISRWLILLSALTCLKPTV